MNSHVCARSSSIGLLDSCPSLFRIVFDSRVLVTDGLRPGVQKSPNASSAGRIAMWLKHVLELEEHLNRPEEQIGFLWVRVDPRKAQISPGGGSLGVFSWTTQERNVFINLMTKSHRGQTQFTAVEDK